MSTDWGQGSVFGRSSSVGLLLEGGVDCVFVFHVLEHGRVGQVGALAHLALVVSSVLVVAGPSHEDLFFKLQGPPHTCCFSAPPESLHVNIWHKIVN